jgi:hypothetical protein
MFWARAKLKTTEGGEVYLALPPPPWIIIIIENREAQKFILNKPVNKRLFFEGS